MNTINPFNVVKANEYSDRQILDYWVHLDSNNDQAIEAKLRPDELMPKYIIGSKGCGKTHILRYFSFQSRAQKYGDVAQLLKSDGYIGIYSRLNGLSSMRFKDEDSWHNLYDYYFELYQSILALETYSSICDAIKTDSKFIAKAIQDICEHCCIILEKYDTCNLIQFLNSKRIAIDRAIIDFSFTRKLDQPDIHPIFNIGDLMMEIPKYFSSNITELKDVNLIYILDEYEKLRYDWQQISLNTIVYEKRNNCTFWIGARKNGYRTLMTNTGEPIHEGHEFQPIDLDAFLKKDKEKFKKFASALFKSRLDRAKIPCISPEDYFEEYSEQELIAALKQKKSLKHWEIFRNRLVAVLITDDIICDIETKLKNCSKGEPLYEKLILYTFYQEWSKLKNEKLDKSFFYSIAEKVERDFSNFINGNNKKVAEKLQKFRYEFLAQLAVENGIKYYMYSGLKDLINISDCNPRVFLTLMKLIIEDSYYRGQNPFEDHTNISKESQYNGINETAKWFLDDIEVYGMERETLDKAMNNLINYLYVNRFSDKPSETSLCAFYFRKEVGMESVNKTITAALNESFLNEVSNDRKDKSFGVPQKTYQINLLISSLYNLPISRRGIKSIPQNVLRSIFDREYFSEFNKYLIEEKTSLNAPFVYPIKKDGIEQKSESEPLLFE